MDSSVEAIRTHSRRNRSAFRRPSTTQSAWAPVLTTVKTACGEGSWGSVSVLTDTDMQPPIGGCSHDRLVNEHAFSGGNLNGSVV
jgi:hypothetical protein